MGIISSMYGRFDQVYDFLIIPFLISSWCGSRQVMFRQHGLMLSVEVTGGNWVQFMG